MTSSPFAWPARVKPPAGPPWTVTDDDRRRHAREQNNTSPTLCVGGLLISHALLYFPAELSSPLASTHFHPAEGMRLNWAKSKSKSRQFHFFMSCGPVDHRPL